MAEFNLAAVLADSVSNLDTGREAIEYIPRERIHADPGNFYSMEGIDQLAANIELCGLMDPIRIRADGDGYKIVSGHRRFAAMTLLAEGGNETYREIPCILDTSRVSEAMQELRLIYANSDTRKLSSADLNKQVDRVTELLYRLQEEGVSFPGRMRDHVAEACKLSRSKIARLNAIKNGLSAAARDLYGSDKIKESAAYKLASLPKSHQNLIVSVLTSEGVGLEEWRINDLAKWLEKIFDVKCSKHDGCCDHFEGKLRCRDNARYSWDICCDRACCAHCDKLGSCKYVCPRVAQEQTLAKQKLKDHRAEERRRNKEQAEEKEACEHKAMARLSALYLNAAKILRDSGKDASVFTDCVSRHEVLNVNRYLSGNFSWLRPHCTVFTTGITLEMLDRSIAMADVLGCSLDTLFMHTPRNEVAASGAAQTSIAMSWQAGDPPGPGAYAVVFDAGEAWEIMDTAYWWPGRGFSYGETVYSPVDDPVDLWCKLPDREPAQED